MSPTGRVLALQAAIGVAGSGAFFFHSTTAGMSAGLALLSVLSPAMYFAWVQARTFNAARLVFQGVMKMLLTVTLMAVSLIVLHAEPLGFFVTFASMQLGYVAGLVGNGTAGQGR